jgi:16S rRNA (guanine(527)-N(7))-methyltransferase RsmG
LGPEVQQDVEQRIWHGGEALGLTLDASCVARLNTHLALIQKWSPTIRLVGDGSEDALIQHILDSLAVARLSLPDCPLVDIGSGAGFPGIPLAALYPERPVLLVESRGRRAAFLKETVRALDLENISVHPGRFERAKLPSGALAIGRAVAPPARFLNMVERRGMWMAVLMINDRMLQDSYLPGWMVELEDRPPLSYRPQHVNLLARKAPAKVDPQSARGEK